MASPWQCLCQANQRTLGPIVVFPMISEPNPRFQQRTPIPQIPDKEILPKPKRGCRVDG